MSSNYDPSGQQRASGSGTAERYPARPAETPPQSAPVETAPPRRAARRGLLGMRLGELIWVCALVVDAFLGLDFLFRALALSHDGFVQVVEKVGGSLARPFSGLFSAGAPTVGHTAFWPALVALVVYTLAALVLIRLLRLLTSPLQSRARILP